MPYTIQEPDIYTIAADPESVAVGDVTGDGIDDIVVATRKGFAAGADDDMVLVYAGTSTGVFGTPARYPIGLPPIRPGLVLVDLDKDGKKDVVVGHDDGLTVMKSAGSALTTAVQHNDGDQFHLENNGVVVTTDLDDDGNADVIGVPWNFDVMIYYGNGTGGFRDSDVFPTEAHGHTGALMGDVDGDNDDDLVIMTGLTSHAFGIHENLGTTLATSAVFRDLPSSDFADGMAIADVTGDGREDVIIADALNRSLYVYGQTTGVPVAFPVDVNDALGVGSPGTMAAGDLDGDGDSDLVVALDPADAIGLYFSGPSGLEAELLVPYPGSLGHSQQGLALGDVNNDSCLDVVSVDRQNGLVVALGDCGGGSFDPCPGSDGDQDGIGDACDCAPTDPLLPNDDGACPVGPPPAGGPPESSCDSSATGAGPGLSLGLALVALALRRRKVTS